MNKSKKYLGGTVGLFAFGALFIWLGTMKPQGPLSTPAFIVGFIFIIVGVKYLLTYDRKKLSEKNKER